MNGILNLFGTHGVMVSAAAIASLVLMGTIVTVVKQHHEATAVTIQFIWAAITLGLICIMTFSSGQVNSGVGFPSLDVSAVLPNIQAGKSPGRQMPGWYDLAGNVLITVPLATALALNWTRRRVVTTVCTLSCTIELAQYFYGHNRTAQLSDIALNTLGALLGCLIAEICRRLAGEITLTGGNLE